MKLGTGAEKERFVEKRILFVDDESELCLEWQKVLQQKFTVIFLCTQADAVHAAKTWEFSVLVVDLYLPPTDSKDDVRGGIDVYRAFRVYNSTAPVILLTNANDPHMFSQFKAEDEHFHVARKRYWDPEDLLELVQSLLE